MPIVILSYGNSQSLHAYDPVADHRAAQGFVVIQPTHLGSRTLGLFGDPAWIEAVAALVVDAAPGGDIETK